MAKDSISNVQSLRIPHRPKWNKSMTPEELDKNEKDSFLNWRRELAEKEENRLESFVTPYEKNLDVWRQLWHVVERSDVVVQIVDCRNPLMFRCPDLEEYIHEIDTKKRCLLVLNKADYLSDELRNEWSIYFIKHNIPCVFFSAYKEQDILNNTTDEVSFNVDDEIKIDCIFILY